MNRFVKVEIMLDDVTRMFYPEFSEYIFGLLIIVLVNK
jgi:hypothetical protein